MGPAKGCLRILLGLSIIALVIELFVFTLPVSLPAGLAGAAWIFTSRSQTPVRSAVNDVLGPVTLGLLLLCTLQLFFNVTSQNENVIGTAERVLVYFDNAVPSWSKLSPVRFASAMILLISATYLRPHLKLVTRFVSANKISSKATAVLSAATSFTFFSNVAVVQPYSPDVYRKIEAIYRHSRNEQIKSVDRFLAAKAIERALTNQHPSALDYCRLLIGGIAVVPAMDVASRRSLAEYSAQWLGHDATAMNTVVQPGFDVVLPHPRAVSILDTQLSAERQASELADEAAKATRELFSKMLGIGSGELKDVAWSFVDTLLSERTAVIEQITRPFADKIVDKYLDKYTDPFVTQESNAVRRLFEHPTNDSTALKEIVSRDTQSAMALMNRVEAASAAQAADTARKAAEAAKTAITSGDTSLADAKLAEAERSATQALKAADLSKAASSSMSLAKMAPAQAGATATMAVGAVNVARDVELAKDLAEGARATKAAADAVEAAKIAKAAAEAVEAARAARIVAEAGEAAKLLIKVVPK
jgi:hypothetical protein